MIHFSVYLKNAWLVNDRLLNLLNLATIYVFSGPVPADADAAIDGTCVSLVTVKNGSTGVSFDTTVVNGVLQKNTSETWSGTAVASGTATFYRLCVGSDTGQAVSATGNYRVQGTVGIDATFDLTASNTALVSGDTFSINSYQLAIGQ